MCVVCGCSTNGPAHDAHDAGTARPAAPAAEGLHPPPVAVDWTAGGALVHPATGDLHYGAGPARVSVPGLAPQRAIRLEADVLGENDRIAADNRRHFRAHGVTALNLVSSPGSGKTTLLCATIRALGLRAPGLRMAVIEGDQQTRIDADRIRATGVPAIQVNTGKGCHLDAPMVGEAFARLPLHDHDHDHDHDHRHRHRHRHGHAHAHAPAPSHGHARRLLFIENVGNLVCPAMWDLGEAAKVAILSVTEGEDKPLKYPDLFAAADLMLLNKVDLLRHLAFDVAACIAHARRVNPSIEVLPVSAITGEGLDDWLDWLLHCTPDGPTRPADGSEARLAGTFAGGTEAALRRRIAELEAELAAARHAPSA